MSDQELKRENVFNGNPEHLDLVDVDAPIESASGASCAHFSEDYCKSAKGASENGNGNEVAVYSFLQAITSFYPKFDTPEDPFGPMWVLDDKRTCLPGDLTHSDVQVVRKLTELSNNSTLLARLYDTLWIVARDHRDCKNAAEAYLDAAENLIDERIWTYAVAHFHRGLYLASRLGLGKPLFERISNRLQEVIREKAPQSVDFLCCQLMDLLVRFRVGEPAEFADLASGIAKRIPKDGDPHLKRGYWEIATELYKLAKDNEAGNDARLAAAETYVEEAVLRKDGERGSYIAAASILSNGIEALRQAKADPERVAELRKRLSEYQEKSLEEYKEYSAEIDLTETSNAARKHVKDENLREALFKFSFGIPLVELTQLRQKVMASISQFPIQHLFSNVHVDEKARTVAKSPGFSQGDNTDEAQVEPKMFSQLRTELSFRVAGYIEPARQQIENDHHPTFGDLVFIVRHNPFVPPGHEEIFLRGIHAGFYNDWVTASHLLVPQVENSMRYILESHSVDVSNLKSDGTQPVKILGAIFGLPETKKIFGDELCFELRCCLIEKMGFDFRNRVAHGFVSDDECRSAAGKYLWWLVIRLCLFPIWNAKVDAAGVEQ